jgi:hypothetical protein
MVTRANVKSRRVGYIAASLCVFVSLVPGISLLDQHNYQPVTPLGHYTGKAAAGLKIDAGKNGGTGCFWGFSS